MSEKYPNIKKHLATYTKTSNELIIIETNGSSYKDDTGKEFLNVNDISCVLGYNHPKFTKRVSELFLNKSLGHLSNFSNDKDLIIKRLMELTNYNFEKVFFAGSGGEVVDYSIKLARRNTLKDGIISFNNSLHGRSFAGAFLSGTPTRKEGFGTGLENIYFWDFPTSDQVKEESADNYKDIAAIIMEPYQAIGGMKLPNKEYFKWLRKYCDDNNIVLIFDEIQTCFGKTGTFFAYEKTGIVPDILLLGKGMSNGFGMGALLMNQKVASTVKPEEMSGGSADNDFMCSVVNTVLDIYEEDEILDNVNKCGNRLKTGINKLINEKKIDGIINGDGLFMSLITSDADRIVALAKERGVILGKKDDMVLFRPPLVITEDEIDKILEAIIQ